MTWNRKDNGPGDNNGHFCFSVRKYNYQVFPGKGRLPSPINFRNQIWPKVHVWSRFGKSATSFLFSEALILLDIVLNQVTPGCKPQPPGSRAGGRMGKTRGASGARQDILLRSQVLVGRGSAITAPAEGTWKTKCSMNEFAQLDLLMNLYITDYYHAPRLTTPRKETPTKGEQERLLM